MTRPVEPFPWRQSMAFGFGILRLSPTEFWSMSVLELQAAIEAHSPAPITGVSRQWLDQALQKHPDIQTENMKKETDNATRR